MKSPIRRWNVAGAQSSEVDQQRSDGGHYCQASQRIESMAIADVEMGYICPQAAMPHPVRKPLSASAAKMLYYGTEPASIVYIERASLLRG